MQTVLTLLQLGGLGFLGWGGYLVFTQGVFPGSGDASARGMSGGSVQGREVSRIAGVLS